jgi:hypothetical protein
VPLAISWQWVALILGTLWGVTVLIVAWGFVMYLLNPEVKDARS